MFDDNENEQNLVVNEGAPPKILTEQEAEQQESRDFQSGQEAAECDRAVEEEKRANDAKWEAERVAREGASSVPAAEPKSPTDQAIDHVISKGYSREAAEKIVAEHGAEAILAGKEGYQSEEDRQKEAVSSEHYCAVCGIELSSNDPLSCAPGKCVMRPVPERSFDPERARRERENKIEK
jgi:hypothetical protein